MYSLESPMALLFELSDVMGLQSAWENRLNLLQQFEALFRRKRGLTSDERQEISGLKSKMRRCARTYKGLNQVMTKFSGEVKGLEAIGLDRVKQITEEIQRLKAEMIQLISDFDTLVLKAARTIELGQP
jgi:hypothetical protein